MTDIKDWKQLHAENLAKIPAAMRDQAVEFLRGYFSNAPTTIADVKEAMAKDPQTWWAPYHLTWGMAVRNLLRRNGYGEKQFGVDNLDDYYVGLIEEAFQ